MRSTFESSRAAEAERVERLAAALREAWSGGEPPTIALVLGSGLGAFAESFEDSVRVPFEDLPELPRSTVPGHAGRFVVGNVGGARVVAQQGRVHLYEGLSAAEVTRAVRALASAGVRDFVLTNAAGGLREEWEPGTLMRIEDHIDLQRGLPLAPRERGFGRPYDAELGAAIDRAARESGVPLERGVYAGLLGPSYETPAEIRMLRWMGADAVGMSTVAEALAAHACGARVAAISCITNHAAGITAEKLDHAEVIEVGKRTADRFTRLLEASVRVVRAASTTERGSRTS